MKSKIKEIDCKDISFSTVELSNGTLRNIKYKNEMLEFQTPRMTIDSLCKENDKEYLILKIIGTQACKTFCLKLLEIEKYFSEMVKSKITSVFNEDHIRVKIPFKYSRPLVKVYKNESLFNYYHICKDMEIISLVTIDKIWIHEDNAVYNLNVKEIMVL